MSLLRKFECDLNHLTLSCVQIKLWRTALSFHKMCSVFSVPEDDLNQNLSNSLSVSLSVKVGQTVIAANVTSS